MSATKGGTFLAAGVSAGAVGRAAYRAALKHVQKVLPERERHPHVTVERGRFLETPGRRRISRSGRRTRLCDQPLRVTVSDEPLVRRLNLLGHRLRDREAQVGEQADPLGITDDHVDDAVCVTDRCDVVIQGQLNR